MGADVSCRLDGKDNSMLMVRLKCPKESQTGHILLFETGKFESYNSIGGGKPLFRLENRKTVTGKMGLSPRTVSGQCRPQ